MINDIHRYTTEQNEELLSCNYEVCIFYSPQFATTVGQNQLMAFEGCSFNS